jgi:hypothetical protein
MDVEWGASNFKKFPKAVSGSVRQNFSPLESLVGEV